MKPNAMRSRSCIVLAALLSLSSFGSQAQSTREECDIAGGTWDNGGPGPRCIGDTEARCLARGGRWFRDTKGQLGGRLCVD